VYLVALPSMLEDAVRGALAEAHVEVVGGPPPPGRLTDATVVVIRASVPRTVWMEELMNRPDVSIVLIEPSVCAAELIELCPTGRVLGRVDGAGIADAVRSATRWEDRPLMTEQA
jgi:hypothetical protein